MSRGETLELGIQMCSDGAARARSARAAVTAAQAGERQAHGLGKGHGQGLQCPATAAFITDQPGSLFHGKSHYHARPLQGYETFVPRHPPFYKTNAASTKAKGGFCECPQKMPTGKEILQLQVNAEEANKEVPGVISEEQMLHVRQVTQTDIEEAWREIVLNHLQKILGLASLDDVLDFSKVIPQHILYNVRNVSKHGVVILQDKTEDLPHWVLSAMKCLANWPRNNDLTQPSYPGFERDVFKTIADYFLNLPEPLLTFEHYELFVNILVLCGYIMVSNRQQGKRKNLDEPSCPQPAKSQHLNRLRRPNPFSFAATMDSEYPAIDGAFMFQCHKCAVDGSGNPSPGCQSTLVGCLNGTQSLLQPQLEQVAIEALQICCLFLPPSNRRKLQLLMRMVSRISMNVDMPQLHEAMGTRMLVIQTFSRCILRCEKEADLDELLGTRLVSFMLDHQQEILQVPPYLKNAVDNHIHHLQRVQITYPSTNISAAIPMYAFCQQISTKEFEDQKVSVSQAAITELLENIVEDKKLSVKDKRKKLKQFQKEYPEIYQNRFPTTDSEAKLFQDKPKIKPPMLITIKKPLKSLQKMQSLRY
ncbi:hypothetical protein scyTo_0014979 [Scyliorhinus torazame]|uniref:Rho-GAP domain-containing protein n=1 Tax=Scyliorhinus torazame TaxID=75743 RepID=A0A401NZN1_SCYTO|nr:hypothetical protein [Scyliorhinus torazame]